MTFTKYFLKNGIRVILAPLQNTESVTVHIGVKVGSVDENKNINGLSHFLEHMMFKGTKNRPSTLAIAKELDAIGGLYNAYTHKEYTAYFAKVLSKHINVAVDILSDMLQNSLFDKNEIEKERGVIIEEINLYQDTPSRYIGDLFEKALWGDSFLGREIIGTKENISKFSRQDLLKHLENFYVGQNMVITVAGKYPKNILSLIEKKFFQIKNKAAKNHPNNFKIKRKQNIIFLDKNTDQTHLAIGFHTFPLSDKRKYATAILATILGGNMSSRFFINIREKLGLCYYITTEAEHYLKDGYIATFSGVKNNDLSTAIEKILEGYKEMAQTEISQEELNKAKDYIKGKTLLYLEESQAVAEFLARQEILLNKILTYREIFEIIEAIKTSDILKIWREIFSLEKLKIACIGPEKNKEVIENIFDKKG